MGKETRTAFPRLATSEGSVVDSSAAEAGMKPRNRVLRPLAQQTHPLSASEPTGDTASAANAGESSGGYKSGRITCLGTFEILSQGNTRSGGTPDLRHLYKDCGLISKLEQSDLYPPAPLMMRSSTSGWSAITQTLQPQAGKLQQPEAVMQLHSISGVTSPAKIAAKEEFGARLTAVLDAKKWPKKKRPEELRKLMQRGAVEITYETARTWINGEKVPSGAHTQILCKQLGANAAYLQHGDGNMFVTDPTDADLAEIQREWPNLSAKGRQHIIQTLRMARRADSVADETPVAQKPVKKPGTR